MKGSKLIEKRAGDYEDVLVLVFGHELIFGDLSGSPQIGENRQSLKRFVFRPARFRDRSPRERVFAQWLLPPVIGRASAHFVGLGFEFREQVTSFDHRTSVFLRASAAVELVRIMEIDFAALARDDGVFAVPEPAILNINDAGAGFSIEVGPIVRSGIFLAVSFDCRDAIHEIDIFDQNNAVCRVPWTGGL